MGTEVGAGEGELFQRVPQALSPKKGSERQWTSPDPTSFGETLQVCMGPAQLLLKSLGRVPLDPE